ncbi:uncharacterized protein LOC103723117 [Phoenix dactylifera]|uniref:Uncharacterized protein LOC103723117 n=1 Tax=Phoenix dactylifera TaxID=42345 RepID=A0A8B7D3C3_PHODC|nr:uncharacterized protein LOC103723117 [Phoenix dactylifera]
MWRQSHKPTKLFHRAQRCRPRALALLALFLVASTLLLCGIKGKPSSQYDPPKLKRSRTRTSTQFRPTVEYTNGTDLIWQIPESPKAVLFIAHGCNGRAANFWDRSPGCPYCVGFPEERLIVLHALDRRFAVLSISSSRKCWSLGKEKHVVKWITTWWIERNKLEKLPIMALGASSGGYFVSALAAEMRYKSIVLMIAEGVFDTMGIPEGYPPTLFVHMPKDQRRMRLIERNMEALRRKGVRVKEVRCLEFPLSPNFLSDRILGLNQTMAVKLIRMFSEKGFLDENGYMRKDGRATRWKQALRERGFPLEKYELLNHIQEELNLAYGYHEMTSLQTDDIFDWFESYMN